MTEQLHEMIVSIAMLVDRNKDLAASFAVFRDHADDIKQDATASINETAEHRAAQRVCRLLGQSSTYTTSLLLYNVSGVLKDAKAGRVPAPRSPKEWVTAITREYVANAQSFARI